MGCFRSGRASGQGWRPQPEGLQLSWASCYDSGKGREKNGKKMPLEAAEFRPTKALAHSDKASCHLFPPLATPLCDELRPGDPLPPCKDWGARYDSRGRMYAHVAHVTHQQGVLQVRWTCLQQFEYVEPRLTRNLNQSFVGSAAGAHHGLVRDRFWWRGPLYPCKKSTGRGMTEVGVLIFRTLWHRKCKLGGKATAPLRHAQCCSGSCNCL